MSDLILLLLLLVLLHNLISTTVSRSIQSHLLAERTISERYIVSSFQCDVAVNINRNKINNNKIEIMRNGLCGVGIEAANPLTLLLLMLLPYLLLMVYNILTESINHVGVGVAVNINKNRK